jgi:hypothetical protein
MSLHELGRCLGVPDLQDGVAAAGETAGLILLEAVLLLRQRHTRASHGRDEPAGIDDDPALFGAPDLALMLLT